MSTILYKNNEKKRIDTPGLCDMKEVFDLIYPVGCYFDTSDSDFDPNTSFTGEWERITNGTMLISQGQYDNGTLVEPGTVFGSRYKNLTIDNIPSHTHTVGAHSHGLNSHTHTYSKSATTSGSTTLTAAQSGVPAHSHAKGTLAMDTKGGARTIGKVMVAPSIGVNQQNTTYHKYATALGGTRSDVTDAWGWFSWSDQHTHTISGSTANNTASNASSGHTHSITLSSTNTGAASGSTANSSEFNTGATGKSEVDSVDVLPPVTCVCRWHRIS